MNTQPAETRKHFNKTMIIISYYELLLFCINNFLTFVGYIHTLMHEMVNIPMFCLGLIATLNTFFTLEPSNG